MKIAAISIADYAEATEGMPHDAERLFFRMLLKMYSREGGLPDSDEENAAMFGYKTVRPYKRLKATLLKFSCGIYVEDDTIKHDRVEQEIAAAKLRREQAREHGRKGGLANGKKEPDEICLDEVCPKFQGSLPEVLAKFVENFDETFSKPHHSNQIKSTTCQKTSPAPSPTPSRSLVAHARNNTEEIDLKKVAMACHAAGGSALNRSSGSLEAIPEPLAWLDGGADLERDILPTIRRIAERTRPGKIKTWGYFHDAVLEAMAKRKATTAAFEEVKSADARALEVMQKHPVVRGEPILDGVFG